MLSAGSTFARGGRRTTELVDVDGSFAKFLTQAPKDVRMHLSHAVKVTTFSVYQRMRTTVRQIAYLTGEMYEALEQRPPKTTGLTGRAGLWDSTQAEIGLYNEYTPNKQPFMRPSVDEEQKFFVRRAISAVNQLDKPYGAGGRGI